MDFKQISSAVELDELVKKCGITLPIEQSPVWRKFEEAKGHKHYGWLLYQPEGQPRAVFAVVEYAIRSFKYFFSHHGPVWIGGKPSEAEEREFLEKLKQLKPLYPKMVFARVHVWHRNEMLYPAMDIVAYDKTVIADLAEEEDEILAKMSQSGRRNIRKGLRNEGLEVVERTDDPQAMHECYKIYEETAERDDFGIHPERVYQEMLDSLGPEHCRLFVAENDGKPVAWAIVTVYDNQGVYYYGGSSRAAHRLYAPSLLHWRIMQTLRSEGVESYDFMGIASDLSPQLAGVTEFKKKFVREETQVAAEWDLPFNKPIYLFLLAAKKIRATLRNIRK